MHLRCLEGQCDHNDSLAIAHTHTLTHICECVRVYMCVMYVCVMYVYVQRDHSSSLHIFNDFSVPTPNVDALNYMCKNATEPWPLPCVRVTDGYKMRLPASVCELICLCGVFEFYYLCMLVCKKCMLYVCVCDMCA